MPAALPGHWQCNGRSIALKLLVKSSITGIGLIRISASESAAGRWAGNRHGRRPGRDRQLEVMMPVPLRLTQAGRLSAGVIGTRMRITVGFGDPARGQARKLLRQLTCSHGLQLDSEDS